MSSVSRPFTVAANWKMHKNPRDTRDYFATFVPKLEASGVARDTAFRKIIFFVPTLDLHAAAEALKGTHIGWGAQNSHWEAKGAFTGETSPQVLAELATTYTLVGHSERRALFSETTEQTGLKVKALQSFGITPMLCVGESLEAFGMEGAKNDDVEVEKIFAKAGAKVQSLDAATLNQWRTLSRDTAWKDFANRNASCAELLKLAEAVS